MRVLVCGGRDFRNSMLVQDVLNNLEPSTVIEGGAPGADRFAALYATAHDVRLETYPANWTAHGKAAGPIRNQQMLDEGKPDLVVAFPGGRGTANMIQKARAAGVEVKEIEEAP